MTGTKVAIVTGASSGIGLSTAVALARKHYAVVLASRNKALLEQAAEKCRQAGAEAMAIPTDVREVKQVESLVSAAVERFGRLDVMVNNAGRGLFARVHEIDEADLRAVFEVNFYGVFYGCQAAAKIMIRQRTGHIFNVSSVIGKRGTPFHGGYSATKFAICGLTDSLRVEMRPYGVLVTSICPTLTETHFFSNSPRSAAAGEVYRTFTRMMSPEIVGRRIAAVAGRDVPEVIFGAGGKFLALAAAVWPRGVDWMMGLYHDRLVACLK